MRLPTPNSWISVKAREEQDDGDVPKASSTYRPHASSVPETLGPLIVREAWIPLVADAAKWSGLRVYQPR